MASTRQTLFSIVIAISIIIGVLCIVAVGGAVMLFRHHVNTQFVAPGTASAELAEAAAHFAGQTPMIELKTDEAVDADDELYGGLRAVVHRDRVAPGEIHALHVLAYDRGAGKLVRADIPRWLLQLASARGRVRIASLDVLQGDRERVTLADFDRRGPGLVMNLNRTGHAAVLVWTD